MMQNEDCFSPKPCGEHAVGQEASMDIRFPLANQTDAQLGGFRNAPEQTNVPLLLIVEDESLVLMAMEMMLTSMGISSISASNGEEALSLFEDAVGRISAVILDLTMPGLGGIETFHTLRAMDPSIRVIIATGHLENTAISEIAGIGVCYILAKPFGVRELSQVIQQILPNVPRDYH